MEADGLQQQETNQEEEEVIILPEEVNHLAEVSRLVARKVVKNNQFDYKIRLDKSINSIRILFFNYERKV